MERVNELVRRISIIEDDVGKETEKIKELYLEASNAMSDSQNYFLNGIQSGPINKSYLLTKKGVEVLGEDVIPIALFIDNVMTFANYPKKKIEVLLVFATHLNTINETFGKKE